MKIRVFNNQSELTLNVADEIVRSGKNAIKESGIFSLVLSGGNTPLHIFRHLSSPMYTNALDWTKVSFFWVDERLVPPEDPESNYGNTERLFLGKIAHGPVYRIKGESSSAGIAANEYRELLASLADSGKNRYPVFDFILLGIGTDGHVASLFPGTLTSGPTEDLVIPILCNGSGQPRISMTFDLINQAKEIVIIASGTEKQEIVKRIVEPEKNDLLPVNKIHPVNGILHLCVDKQAGGEIPAKFLN